MKFSYVSALVALTLASVLAACGGKAQYTVQGTISGLNNSGLQLANGGETISVAAGATSFAFTKQIDYGDEYSISIAQQPDHMTCERGSYSGTAGYTVAIAAQIVCSQNTYTLGGQYSGVTAAADGTARTVTLINGSTGGQAVISSANGTANEFTLTANVADGSAYGVTILSQPDDLSCTLQNATGVMHENAISNIVLTCVPK